MLLKVMLFKQVTDIGKAIANDTDKAWLQELLRLQNLRSVIKVLLRHCCNFWFKQVTIFFISSFCRSIVETPPSTAGQYVTRVGEAGSTGQFIVNAERPILLSWQFTRRKINITSSSIIFELYRNIKWQQERHLF